MSAIWAFGSEVRETNNRHVESRKQEGEMTSFYIALSFIKLFRTQPEPEFVYLSDARIPPVVLDSQVRHDIHQIVPLEKVPSGMTGNSFRIFDDSVLKGIKSDRMTTVATTRIPEETYYKYRGEQILNNSGLRCVQLSVVNGGGSCQVGYASH